MTDVIRIPTCCWPLEKTGAACLCWRDGTVPALDWVRHDSQLNQIPQGLRSPWVSGNRIDRLSDLRRLAMLDRVGSSEDLLQGVRTLAVEEEDLVQN
jgi:hypothetical protein